MGNVLNSTRLRFGPIAIAAAVLGLALGLAMPVSPVAADVPSDATALAPAKPALPNEAANTERRDRRCRQGQEQQELAQQ